MNQEERKALVDLCSKWKETRDALYKAQRVLPEECAVARKFFGFGSGSIGRCIRDLEAFIAPLSPNAEDTNLVEARQYQFSEVPQITSIPTHELVGPSAQSTERFVVLPSSEGHGK